MTTTHEKDGPIGAALESLTRQVSEGWQQKLAELRARVDQQFASLESTLNEGVYTSSINATVKQISRAAAEQASRARQQAEATASQALGAIETDLRTRLATETEASAALRAELDAAKKELRKLKDLGAERSELVQNLASVTAAKTAAEAQCRQLEAVNQKLSEALSKMLRARESGRAAPAEEPPQPKSASPKRPAAPPPAPTQVGMPPSAPVATAAPAAPAKKPLQFSTPARDAKRVKIRRGITVDVDGIPGEMVDLSLGGAQMLLRQAVRPSQLVRLMIPTALGPIVCRGRIVWSVYEQPPTSLAVYRTGMKFDEAEAALIEEFMEDYAEEAAPTRKSSGAA